MLHVVCMMASFWVRALEGMFRDHGDVHRQLPRHDSFVPSQLNAGSTRVAFGFHVGSTDGFHQPLHPKP